MGEKNTFVRLFSDSLAYFSQNTILAFPPLILLAVIFLFSKLSTAVNSQLVNTNSFVIILWFIISALIYLALTSFFLSGLIGMSKEAIRKKAKIKDFFFYSKKFWLKNLLVIIIILAVYALINLISIYGVRFIGQSLGLEINIATLIFFLVYFIGLSGILIFLTFSSFYLIINNLKIKESIKNSINLVKKNYTFVLSILIIFFIINQLLEIYLVFWNGLLFELLSAIFIIPYLSLILTRFVLQK